MSVSIGHEKSNTSRNPSHWKTSAMKINLALMSFTLGNADSRWTGDQILCEDSS